MQSSISNKKFKVVFGAWWFTWAELHVIVLTKSGLLFSIALTDSFISNILIATTCLLISNNMKYYLPSKEKYWYVLVISCVMSSICLFVSRAILLLKFNDNPIYVSMLGQSLIIRFCVALLLNGCMSTISLLWYTQQEQKENESRKTDIERLAKDAELYKLRQQLQPHFLFNSLNSINALIGFKPDEARHMIQQLSDFLRGTLKKEEQQWVSLAEELSQLELYLAIEKVRFGHRLSTIINSDELNDNLKIPVMLLQPIVENAIKFGLYDTTEDVIISLTATMMENNLIITVQNPFDPSTSNLQTGTGFGLSSVQRRLYLLFARQNLLKTSAENNLFTTTIIIPQIV